MISTKQFSQNKFFRYTAYTIVIGFAIMMFLPTTISLPELLRGTSNEFITVNDREIFNKNIPQYRNTPQLQASIYEVLQDFNNKNSSKDAQWLKFMLNNWNLPSKIPNSEYERHRSHLRSVIQWTMNYNLAQELGFDLSKDKLNDFIKKSFNLYLKEEYKRNEENRKIGTKAEDIDKNEVPKQSFEEYKEENIDYYWEFYYKWASKYLKEYYLVNLVTNPIQNGQLAVLADVDKELEVQTHKVAVEFGLFTYNDYLKTQKYKNTLDVQKIKKYYKETKSSITADVLSFKSKDDAQKALNDKDSLSLKFEDNKDKAATTKDKDKDGKEKTSKSSNKDSSNAKDNEKHKLIKNKYISGNDKLYDKLAKYIKDDITKVIEDESVDESENQSKDESEDESAKYKYKIYKIKKKEKSFEEAKVSKSDYERLLKEYGKAYYDELKPEYEKYALSLMNSYLKEAKESNDMLLKGTEDFKYIRKGKTKEFTQDSKEIRLESKNPKQDKTKNNNITNERIDEFVSPSYGINSKPIYNQAFFKEAFLLDVNEISKEVLSYEMQGSAVQGKLSFFVLKKVSDTKPKAEEDITRKKDIIRKVKLSNQYIFMNGWIDYLQRVKDYEVSINNSNILASLGIRGKLDDKTARK